MYKKIVLVFIFLSLLSAKLPTELFKQIDNSKKSLDNVSKQKSIINKELQKIAKKIKKLKEEVKEYDKKIYESNKKLGVAKARYKSAKSEIRSINNIIKSLDYDIKQKNKEFARKISQTLGEIVAQDKSGERDEKAVLKKEFFQKYKKKNQEEILKLSKNIEQNKELRRNLIKKRDAITASIKDVLQEKKKYESEKKKREALLKQLAKQETIYTKKLKNIFKKQTVIRLTLAKLNILKEEAVKEAKRKERELKRRIAQLKKLKLRNKKERENSLKSGRRAKIIAGVKHRSKASSYITNNITSYRGPKTMAPLKKARIIKPFGPFIDPVFNIKSFNDSVTLVSNVGDKRVYNVLNGEVAFIGKNAMLRKFVVIKHKNNIHTIYADLDRLSPFVKVGAKLKKGAVIGKVKRKLIFEATKNGKFINPQRLIKI